MKKAKRCLLLALAVLMALTCGGCATAGGEGLYALPRMSDEYVQLETLIAQRIAEGGEYAAPVGGANRQSVQLQDLDGDGEAEAVAFLADSGHKPTVCIYRRDPSGEYALDTVINGDGSAVSSVEYADVNGDGVTELIIAWQISGDMGLLSVYTLQGEEPAALLSADCSEFLLCDLDGDGMEEIFDLVLDYGGASSLTRYSFDSTGAKPSTARLSQGITEVLRAKMGLLSDGGTALFVESRWGEDELITDVFAVKTGILTNITTASGERSNTLRPMGAYAADINGDRVMELPESSGDILNWYSLDASGRRDLALSTYHDYENGWYLALSEEMIPGLTVAVTRPLAGETAATFSVTDDAGNRQELLTIYTLTGENRTDWGSAAGRFILGRNETTVYAAELLTQELTPEEITESFNLIYTEWQTGAL